MRKIGLTGGIGSGKSIVAHCFSVLGVPVYYSDLRAKIAVQIPDIKTKIIQKIGTWCYQNDGTYNTILVAQHVFKNPNLLQQLTAIIYPWLEKDFNIFLQNNQDQKYVLKEAAVLLETDNHKNLDGIILVSAPLEERFFWLKKRGMNLNDVKKRMNQQWTDERKLNFANWHIRNEKNTLLMPQILRIHEEILAKCEADKKK